MTCGPGREGAWHTASRGFMLKHLPGPQRRSKPPAPQLEQQPGRPAAWRVAWKLHVGLPGPPHQLQRDGHREVRAPLTSPSGIWLGLELQAPRERMTGAVGDKRYFTCKPNHGACEAQQRTYRGINGSKLVDENC